jgi:hypothetical protein
MRKLRAEGASLRAISDKMKAAGVWITYQGAKNALAAADRPADRTHRHQSNVSFGLYNEANSCLFVPPCARCADFYLPRCGVIRYAVG